MLLIKNRKGININKAITNFTVKSPRAKVIHGISVPYKAIEKNKNVSIIDPIIDEERGAIAQCSFLNVSKILISILWAIKKAKPEPIAILIEIISEKFVDINKVKSIPITNPI